MREIKFRAWCRCGEWDEDEDLQKFQMIDPHDLAFEEFAPLWELLQDKKDHCYFMQYTGLKDKNDKEIYCSDLVKYYDSTTMWLTSEIIDTGVCFAVKTSENPIPLYEFIMTYDYDGYPVKEIEIIGNIYENPELLKEEMNESSNNANS